MFNRVNEAAKVGVPFEGPVLREADLVEAGEADVADIRVFEEMGSLPRPYARELQELLTRTFPQFETGDFVSHLAEGACLFSCKGLDLYTHG